jgi:hypothetical protein
MTRAVLDANVLVSVILAPQGIPARILTAWQVDRFHLVLSEAILNEIDRVLRYPRIARRHRWSEARRQRCIEDLAHLAIMTPGAARLAVIAEDPPDDRYLECAIEGEADYIVGGDQHLLELGEYQGIRIVTPRAFLDVLRRHPGP